MTKGQRNPDDRRGGRRHAAPDENIQRALDELNNPQRCSGETRDEYNARLAASARQRQGEPVARRNPKKRKKRSSKPAGLGDDRQKGIATVIATLHQKIDERTIVSGSPLNCTSIAWGRTTSATLENPVSPLVISGPRALEWHAEEFWSRPVKQKMLRQGQAALARRTES